VQALVQMGDSGERNQCSSRRSSLSECSAPAEEAKGGALPWLRRAGSSWRRSARKDDSPHARRSSRHAHHRREADLLMARVRACGAGADVASLLMRAAPAGAVSAGWGDLARLDQATRFWQTNLGRCSDYSLSAPAVRRRNGPGSYISIDIDIDR